MTYPFKKRSFWIVLSTSLLIIFLFPPVFIARNVTWWDFFFTMRGFFLTGRPINVGTLIFEIMILFLLNYLGHLIFSKSKTK